MRLSLLLVGLLAAGLLLTACDDANTGSRLPETPVFSTVTLSFAGLMGAGAAPAAVPPGATSAIVEMYLRQGESRSLAESVALSFANPTAEVELLTGEVYDFDLVVRDSAERVVAFDSRRHKVIPHLQVAFAPTTIIESVQLGELYYDGSQLTVPVLVLTPSGSRASHLDYLLHVTVEGGDLTQVSGMGAMIAPHASSSPVTLRVDVTGKLASRSEGTISETFVITPSSVTPAEVSFAGDLVPPTVQFHSSMNIDDLVVGSTRYVPLYASDDQALARVSLYVNMRLVWTATATGTTFSNPHLNRYGLTPEDAGLYTLHAVAEDAAGNTSVEMLQLAAR